MDAADRLGRPSSVARLVKPTTVVLAVSFAAVGVGNLVIPDFVHSALPIDYLYVTLAILGSYAFTHLNRLGGQLGRVLILFVFSASVIPGIVQLAHSDYGYSKLLGFVIAVLLILAPLCLNERRDGVFNALLALFLMVSIAFSFMLLIYGADAANGRFSAFGLNPIGISRATSIGAVIAFAALMIRGVYRARTRIVLLLVFALGLVATVSTGSRGPVISALAACLLILIALVLRRKVSFWWLVTLALAGFAVLQGLLADGSSGLSRVLDATDSGRGSIWADTISVIAGHPAGIGWGNLAFYLPQYVPSGTNTLYPHNLFLEMTVEGGWFALIATILLVGAAFVGVLQAVRESAAIGPLCAMGILTFSFINAQVSSDIVGNRMMWLAVGFALAFMPRRKAAIIVT